MLGFRPAYLSASGRGRRRSEGSITGRAAFAPRETLTVDVGSFGTSVFPEVAWLFAVLSLPPRLDESGLRECLRQLERRFHNQRVPDSYLAGVRQAAALLVAGIAGRSMDVEAVPLLDMDQRLVPSHELLNLDTPCLLEGIDRSSPLLKLTSRSSSGLTDTELTHLGCLSARAAVLERLPPGFCPDPLPCAEVKRIVMLIRSEAFKEGLSQLFVHCGLSDGLLPSELAFLNGLEVALVRELPLRLTFKGQDATRPNRSGGIHHLEANTVYLCNRDSVPFSKMLPALAFRLRQGFCLASGRPLVSMRQHMFVAMLRQEDPGQLPALVKYLISGESPDRVRSSKRRACVSLESTPVVSKKANFGGSFVLGSAMGGASLLRKFGDVAEDVPEKCDPCNSSHVVAAEHITMTVTWSMDPADREGE